MLGFTRDAGPLTWLVRRSPASFAAVGFLIGVLAELAIQAWGVWPALSSGPERAVFTLAMGLVGALVAWHTAQRVRQRSAAGGERR